jgi:hypothetical protein
MAERSRDREGGEGRESRRESRSGPQGWRRAREARRAAAAGRETGKGTEPARKVASWLGITGRAPGEEEITEPDSSR